MRFLFVMDPPESMLADRDTSFALMRGAQARGHACWHCLLGDLAWDGRLVSAQARSIRVSDPAPHVVLSEPEWLVVDDFDAVFIRKDPPFDTDYAHGTQILDALPERVLVVNSPRGLRDANEKLFALRFPEYTPRTLVSARPPRLLEFLQHIGGAGVLKPLDGAGGIGVVRISSMDGNARAVVDLLTAEGRRPAVLQQYLPDVHQGDKRVLLLDGASLGCIRRIPRSDDFRSNIHVGGHVEPATLTAREERLVQDVGGRLREQGLYFVGLDLIAEHLIEVNVTSPTGLQQLSRHCQRPVEQEVIAWVENQRLSRS